MRSAENRSQESALGVVVLDQAVVERFRTDQEFGGQSYGFDIAIQRFLGFKDQLAGVSVEIQRLDTSRPIPPDLDLLAAVLLRNNTNHYPTYYSSEEFEQDAAEVFGNSIRKPTAPVRQALSDRYERTDGISLGRDDTAQFVVAVEDRFQKCTRSVGLALPRRILR